MESLSHEGAVLQIYFLVDCSISLFVASRGLVARQEQALFQYRQTVLNAFREVEDALVKTTRGREEVTARENQSRALNDAARLARLRFEGGTTDSLQVLDAERSLFSAQLGLVEKKVEVIRSLVEVYKAMGGGWIETADKLGDPGKTD